MNGAQPQPQPQKARGCLRDAAIVACVLAALILVVGAAAYFAFVVADHTLQQEDLANLTESEVRADFADLKLSTPDTSELAYVSNESLDGPRFDAISIGAIRYGTMKDGQMTPTTRTVTADALWQNGSVQVKRAITAEFEFANATDRWKLSIYTLADPRAYPLRPLNMYDIEGDVVPLLRLYDPALGDAYADAHVQLSGELDEEGGTVKAVLSTNIDGQPMECTVNLSVAWSTERGWQVEVASVTSASSDAVPQVSDQQALVPEAVENGETGARTLRLVCHEGDLVTMAGTLSQTDGIFMLETEPTAVSMAGRNWVLSRFVVTGPGTALTEALGKSVTVTGYLTVGYVLDEAPLSLAVKSLV